MKKYQISYVDASGIKGEKEFHATDEQDAYKQLKDAKLTPILIKEAKQGLIEGLQGSRVTSRMIETFITNLASLLSSGINLDRALTLVARSAESNYLQELIIDLQKDVRAGQSFANTLAEYPEYFDELVVNLVKIGESTGELDNVLLDLSEQLKFQDKVNSQIKQASIYPLIIVAVCVMSVMFILFSVVPQLSVMLEQAKSLPWYTVALMSASDFVISDIGKIALFSSIIVVIYVFKSQSESSKNFRVTLWRWCKTLPLIKGMHTLTQQLRFAAAMKVTLNAGVSITDALELSRNTIVDQDVQSKIKDVKIKIQSGIALKDAMEETNLFASMELGFIEVGEETGNLDRAFSEIQERKSFEFDTKLAALLKMLEPLLILVMGVIVGGVVIIMMLSILSAQDVGL